MGNKDTDRMTGKAKETTGKVTGNQDLQDEGKTEQSKADFKENVDDAKSSAKGAVEGAKETLTGDDDR